MPQPLAVTAFMASPGRFELPAPRLGGVCSIQLSYGDIFDFSWSRMERSASQDFDDLIIRRETLHPIAKSRLICVRRPFLHPFIEFFFKILGALLTAGINNMTITLRDHLRLSVTGVTLDCFNISASQHQLVADTAVPQAVK